jgi:DNA-directed RNA polymerase subunit RPC12/RpoP
MLNEAKTFNGNNTTYINDIVNFCPYCGSKVLNDFKYCPTCGKEIPRTYTGSMYVIHWNSPGGTVTYPHDEIIKPNTIC